MLGGDELLGLELLQVVGQVGFRFFLIHRGGIFGQAHFVIPVGFRHLGICLVFRRLPFLIGLRGADHRIAVGFRLPDDGITLHLGNARFPQCVQVPLFILNVANGETDDLQPHIGQVAGGDILHALRELIAFAIHLFYRHHAKNGAQVAFHRLQRDLANLRLAFA